MVNKIMLKMLQRLYDEGKITFDQIAPEYQAQIIQAPKQNT